MITVTIDEFTPCLKTLKPEKLPGSMASPYLLFLRRLLNNIPERLRRWSDKQLATC